MEKIQRKPIRQIGSQLSTVVTTERFALTFFFFTVDQLLENLDTQKEKRRVETSSEDPFVQLRHFEPPSLVLWQVCIVFFVSIQTSRKNRDATEKKKKKTWTGSFGMIFHGVARAIFHFSVGAVPTQKVYTVSRCTSRQFLDRALTGLRLRTEM